MNGLHSSCIDLHVNARLSKPSGKVSGMIWSQISLGKPGKDEAAMVVLSAALTLLEGGSEAEDRKIESAVLALE